MATIIQTLALLLLSSQVFSAEKTYNKSTVISQVVPPAPIPGATPAGPPAVVPPAPEAPTPPKPEDETIENAVPPGPVSKEELESNLNSMIQGNNLFAFQLYNKLKNVGGNLCFSPYSVSASMAIPFVGSSGQTQVEIRNALHYLTREDQVNEVYSILDRLFTTPWYLGPNECKIFIANALWIQRDIKILPGFFDAIAINNKASIKQIDFLRNPEGARLNINGWIQEKTQGKIVNEVNSGDIDSSTKMLVTSSMYMKAVWSTPFDPNVTRETSFFIDQYTTGSILMMNTSGQFKIFRADDLTVIELPYRPSYQKKPRLSMIIVLPKTNFGLAQVEQKFYLELWSTWMANLREESVILSIPKFSLRQSFNLTSIMQSIGLNMAFRSGLADFSKISNNENLSLSAVVHESAISIDEKGSDAVAANPIEIGQRPEFGSTALIAADHPFIFLIVDMTNNVILYMGRIVKPS